MRALAPLLLAIATLALWNTPAHAGGATPTCLIRADPVEFGIYSALDIRPQFSVGRIVLVCTGSALPSGAKVTLSTGASGSYLRRTLTGGSDVLAYNLYVDLAHLRVAGDGTGGSEALSAHLATPRRLDPVSRATFRIYASIPPYQRVPAGLYTDVIEVTVEF